MGKFINNVNTDYDILSEFGVSQGSCTDLTESTLVKMPHCWKCNGLYTGKFTNSVNTDDKPQIMTSYQDLHICSDKYNLHYQKYIIC